MDVIPYRNELKECRRIVIKIGTNTIIDSDGRFNHSLIRSIAEEIRDLKKEERQFAIVTSGAIGLGNRHMGWKKTESIVDNQCAASVGQALLMHAYHDCFKEHGLIVSQILLTYSDIFDPRRETTIRNLTKRLLETGMIPIINENDSVSTEEISFGDNDILSAHVARLTEADLLILLTNTDGLYRDIKKEDTINVIENIDPEIKKYISEKKSPDGKGGMSSKLIAAELAKESGILTVIAKGTEKDIIKRILSGEHTGTLFSLNGGRKK
ncbi:MAG: glutamate 5-kinase [archaeon]